MYQQYNLWRHFFFFFRCSIHWEPVIAEPPVEKKYCFHPTAQLQQKVIGVTVAAAVKRVQAAVWIYTRSFQSSRYMKLRAFMQGRALVIRKEKQ